MKYIILAYIQVTANDTVWVSEAYFHTKLL